MSRVLLLTAASVVLGLLTGCSIHGKWSLASVEPSAARRDFQYEVLTLEKDGSFYAEAKEPDTKTTSGIYRLDKGVLSLREHDGEEHVYQAELGSDCLKLKQPWKDRELVATFDRKN